MSEGTHYFGWMRHDILSHVPKGARSVLSVGCASGLTEGELVKRGARVVGLEVDSAASKIARQHGIIVHECDAEDIGDVLQGQLFDCLIYADILEHLKNPLAILRNHIGHLNPGGTVIVSVPNFRHFSVLAQLLIRGYIKYTDAGILDRTHLRITTRRMVQQWFDEIELATCGVEYRMSQRRERIIARLTLGLGNEFVARQVIVVGKKRP